MLLIYVSLTANDADFVFNVLICHLYLPELSISLCEFVRATMTKYHIWNVLNDGKLFSHLFSSGSRESKNKVGRCGFFWGVTLLSRWQPSCCVLRVSVSECIRISGVGMSRFSPWSRKYLFQCPPWRVSWAAEPGMSMGSWTEEPTVHGVTESGATERLTGRQSRWIRARLDDVILTWPVRASADGFGGTQFSHNSVPFQFFKKLFYCWVLRSLVFCF